MPRARWMLVALLVVATALFAAGAIAERSETDEHAEAATSQAQESSEGRPGEADRNEGETVLGIDVESTPLIALGVIVGLALAGLAATNAGRLSAVLLAIALIALAWAALDVREVIHQFDESRTGIALVAIAVAVLHLAAAALAGRLARQARQVDVGSPGHAGTMPA